MDLNCLENITKRCGINREINIIMSEETNIDDDYKYSRDTYYDLLEKGRESLDLMMEVAKQSEHPRAFEVLSNMMKQMAEINDKLMDLNKKQKEIKMKEINKPKEVTNNNLFLGSTVELQRLLHSDIIDVKPTE